MKKRKKKKWSDEGMENRGEIKIIKCQVLSIKK